MKNWVLEGVIFGKRNLILSVTTCADFRQRVLIYFNVSQNFIMIINEMQTSPIFHLEMMMMTQCTFFEAYVIGDVKR